MVKCLKRNVKNKVISAFVAFGMMLSATPSFASISVARAFYELAQQKDVQKIRLLQDKGYSIESTDALGYNAVCIAVSRQDKVAYKVLTSIGAKQNPKCLDKIPEDSYRRFFGTLRGVTPKAVYKSDAPYITSTVALGAGALIAAYALRGSSSGGGNTGGGDEPEVDVKCPQYSQYNKQTKRCECVTGYGKYGSDDTCYKKIEGCVDQQEDKCIACNDAFFELKNGRCERTSCPENSKYNNISKKCDCINGYGHYGDEEYCYKTISKCEKQTGGVCDKCMKDHEFIDNVCKFTGTCGINSHYDDNTGVCVCDTGYVSQSGMCYKKIDNCSSQNGDECTQCNTGYVLKNGKCYKEIPNCVEQIEDKCELCEVDYGLYGGDGSECYKKIENCVTQVEDKCEKCNNGMGTHGDPAKDTCYKDVENCNEYSSQDREKCLICDIGYSTYGDPDGICYNENQCSGLKNAVPNKGSCICDIINGYTGDPYGKGCSQAKEGDYQEGDGSINEWTNFSAIHCNSKGKYIGVNALGEPICECYASYGGADCSDCAEGYRLEFDRCYAQIDCSIVGEHMVQSGDNCVCDMGYIEFEVDGKRFCSEEIECGIGMRQTGPGECSCKINYVPVKGKEGVECECPIDDGYVLDAITKMCVKKEEEDSCEEKNNIDGIVFDAWEGAPTCNVCPKQYEITTIDGRERCGQLCAQNRQVSYNEDGSIKYNENGTLNCDACASGYALDAITGNCIYINCLKGVTDDGENILEDGYLLVDGKCVCDESLGYSLGPLGNCVLKEAPLIGLSTSNINNGTINVINKDIYRDVYGMKPVLVDDQGKEEPFDSVYNALNYEGAEINIFNHNSHTNSIYGIYSQSDIYNAASVNSSGNKSVANINIEDTYSKSKIYGIFNDNSKNIYNAFAYNGDSDTHGSKSEGAITITKTDSLQGEIAGIYGNGNIVNAYSVVYTDGNQPNLKANAYSQALATININSTSLDKAIGIVGGLGSRINNAYSYLGSAISTAVSKGDINILSKGLAIGIQGGGTIVNSETQFNKSYNMIKEFGAEGNINVVSESNSNSGGAYGIWAVGENEGGEKLEVYNAMGYNSVGNINVTNTAGGKAYGIYSETQLYSGTDGVNPIFLYNNTYNAFRSSKVYGGSSAIGNINIISSGSGEMSSAKLVGIYAAGDVFNAYINSGDEVNLKAEGNILIKDDAKGRYTSQVIGIEGGGSILANAYSEGENKNTQSQTIGNITIEAGLNEGELSAQGNITGLFSNVGSRVDTINIYNAALINDKSSVDGSININIKDGSFGYGSGDIYGIYAVRNPDNNKLKEGVLKKVYNAYYDNIYYDEEGNRESRGSVNGEIRITSSNSSKQDTARYYGIYINGGQAYNSYSTNPLSSVSGSIYIDAYGGQGGGEIVGMNGIGLYNNTKSIYDTYLNNANKSSVEVHSRGKALAYGMKGDKSQIYNSGDISVKSGNKNAYGIYVDSADVTNDEDGKIIVSSNSNGYGIYATMEDVSQVDNRNINIINAGDITVYNGKNNYGIYAKQSGTYGTITVNNTGTIKLQGIGNNVGIYASGAVTVANTGTISINNVECQGENCYNGGTAISLANGAKFDNAAIVESVGSLDLSKFGGEVLLSQGGRYTAEDNLSGDLAVSVASVSDTFDKEVVLDSAISAKNVNDLNITSKSYMYDASLSQNSETGYDVVATMKDFNELTSSDKAKYYDINYQNENNIRAFNELKKATSSSEFDLMDSKLTGTNVLPNITQENLKVMRSLDAKMMSDMFIPGDDIRRFAGANNLYTTRGDLGNLTGYDLNASSVYSLVDKKINNKYRLGLGISFTNIDTDYNDNSSREGFMVQGYVPLTYKINGLTAVSMARLGYSDGKYKRVGLNSNYEADTTDITYGLLNELRYKVDLGYLNLIPFAGLNISGWYQDNINESGDDLSLKVASSHVLSVEGALGLYLNKEIEFDTNNKLDFALGLGYYHEFASPYSGIDAQINSMSLSSYKMRNSKLDSRDRGVISAKFDYLYKDFSIYGELMQYLEDEYPINVDLGLRYRF